ncbi:hypothetical protein [Leptospira noguchii]|uniref:hypothetical protein n=1 Tax=Leptospira noguchii TaxID=28182 RepID=UPI001FB5E9F9|nr:hypothetical protein [Leptospira noguchii]UOG40328.1 hypothetical protein MAL05_10470 [Leptospira noguchii]
MEIEPVLTALIRLLKNAELESLRVHKLCLQIEFSQIGKQDLPVTIWLTTNNSIFVAENIESINRDVDYYDQRVVVIKDLYYLIGEKISSVSLSENGELSILIGDKILFLFREKDEFEEVWKIMDNSTSEFVNHDWYITLLDYNEFDLKYPKPRKN